MKYIILRIASVLLFIPLFIPFISHADGDIVFTPVDSSSYTLENQSRYSVAMTIDGKSLTDISTTTAALGTSHVFSYTISPSAFWAPGLSKEDVDSDFADSLAANITYLELWKGSVFGPDATLMQAWDTNGKITGSITATLPIDGNYFFLVNTPNVLYRKSLPECTETIIEDCYHGPTLLAGTMDYERTSFMAYVPGANPFIRDSWGLIHSYTLAIGAVRFAVVAPTVHQYSNILFLPGVTGSRLFEKVKGKEKKDWELGLLSSQADARALYMDAEGKSKKAIYTKADGTIAHADIPLIGFDIYKTFFDQLASLKTSNLVRDYSIFPYDWRQSPTDVAENGTPYDDGTHSLTKTLIALASTSPTGKVTIVGHSNGGLVAKALVTKLKREGKANLVDTVILVDTPQLGTPDTLVSMLHGDFGALTGIGGLFLSQENARGLMENMPAGYDLLPSAGYFSKISDPVIDLSYAPQLRMTSGLSSTAIASIKDFTKFLTASKSRLKPASDDVMTPDTLSTKALASSAARHTDLDTWIPPTGVRLIQIAGWGLNTTKSIAYTETRGLQCTVAFQCVTKTFLHHALNTVIDGDNTVVIPSETAIANNQTYYLDLFRSNRDREETRGHADITEMNAFQNLFPLLLASTTPSILPRYVSTAIPFQEHGQGGTRIHLRGPAVVVATDSKGRQTGTKHAPKTEVVSTVSQIPNSTYKQVGDDSYLTVTGINPLQVAIQATASDTITVDIATSSDSGQNQPTSYGDISVTASTTATITLDPNATTTPPILVDTDGDGNTDTEVNPVDPKEDALSYLNFIIKTVPTMGIESTSSNQLVSKFSNAKKLLLGELTWDTLDDDHDQPGYYGTTTATTTPLIKKIKRIQSWITLKTFIMASLQDPDSSSTPVTGGISFAQSHLLLQMIEHLLSLL